MSRWFESTHHHESPSASREGIFYRFATDSATIFDDSDRKEGQESQLVLETNEKFPYKLASLSDAKGDVKKRWHISFYVWHKHEGKLTRKQVYLSNKIKTKAVRYREADKMIREINRLLQSGYVIGQKNRNPYQTDQVPLVPGGFPLGAGILER